MKTRKHNASFGENYYSHVFVIETKNKNYYIKVNRFLKNILKYFIL